MRFLLPALAILLFALLPAAATAQTGTGPTAATRGASAVTVDSATVHATIDPNGEPTTYRFEYGTTSAYGLETSSQEAVGFGDRDVTADLGGLSEDTVYHYRVVAWPTANPDDPAAVVQGRDQTFRTLALPFAATGPVRDVRPDSATLTGRVNPNRAPTTYFFEWGLTTGYGQQTPAGDAGHGSTVEPVSFALGGLAPNTVYHFRTVAMNAAGVKRGGDRAFRTFRGPTGITVAAPVRTVRYGRQPAIDGVVQGSGLQGLRVSLETQPFPFVAPFAAIGDSVTVRRDGSFHLVGPPLQISSRLRVVTRTSPPVTSPAVTAFSRLLVGASTQALSGHRYLLAGSVTPHLKGAKVSIQRRKGNRWVSMQRTRTASIGHGRVGYRAIVRQVPARRRYRIIVRARNAAYAHGTSRTVTVPRR